MATDEEISTWLDEKPQEIAPQGASEEDIGEFLEKPTEAVKPVVSAPPQEVSKYVSDFGAGATDTFLNLLDIPNSAYNWAAEQLDWDYRFPSTRDSFAEYGIGTREGEEPDTGTYRAGEYTMMGLEFLAPILKVGRVFEAAAPVAQVGITKGVAQQIAKPFAASPKTALGVELASGVTSGYGAHYGKQEFGVVGEQIGGLAGVAPAILAGSAKRTGNYIIKSFFPFTEKGAKAKAGQVFRQLRESPNYVEEIGKQERQLLDGTRITPARLSKEPYLIALEKALIHDDPQMVHTLRKIDAENNAVAKTAMKELSGGGAIEDAMKSLGGRYAKLKSRLDLKVDSSLAIAKEAVNKVAPLNQRKMANIEVGSQIKKSLKAARDSENAIWREVDKTATASTQSTKGALTKALVEMEEEADKKIIPNYVYQFVGRLNKIGQLKGGKWGEQRHVGGIQQLRSRLLQTINEEKFGEAVNWNRVRILEDLEEAMLKDMSNSSASKGLDDAITYSRELNKKFKGDIMSVILRNSRTGGSLTPSLTLESLGTGPKGAFHIRRILDASPESKSNIEDILKMDIVQQKVVKGGALNIDKAKDYMHRNEQVMDIFPTLKDDMDNAIALAETHKYFEGSAAVRLKKAEKALGFSLADKTNPGTFLTKILASKNPEQTISRVMRQVNTEGKAGIKNDVIGLVLKKAKTPELDINETPLLSGKKAVGFWNENKQVLSKALNKDENKRLEQILNTLRLGDDPKDIPIDIAKEALKPEKTVLGWVVEVAAARAGALLGQGTSGASLKTASKASNTAKDLMDKLDMGLATKLLKSAVQDKELYMELSENMTTLQLSNQKFEALNGWFMAHLLSSMEEQKELED